MSRDLTGVLDRLRTASDGPVAALAEEILDYEDYLQPMSDEGRERYRRRAQARAVYLATAMLDKGWRIVPMEDSDG